MDEDEAFIFNPTLDLIASDVIFIASESDSISFDLFVLKYEIFVQVMNYGNLRTPSYTAESFCCG